MPRWDGLTQDQRFWNFVKKTDGGCWAWTGAVSEFGYGRFARSSAPRRHRHVFAHRYSYLTLVGPIPDGYHLDHKCRNPPCVNPEHLEPVTPKENTNRGVGPNRSRLRQLSKTHCPHGHEYSTENTRSHAGKRFCRACEAERSARRRAMRQKEERA